MSKAPLTGSRIRSYRLEKGMRQAAVARSCDISASYLNLIEHNRRKIGGKLLHRIAQALDVDPTMFSGGAEIALASALDAAADAHPKIPVERPRAEELASRFPGWAQLIEAQHAEVQRLEQVAEQLGDRLTHDPFLSASMHSVLSSITAIRSASAILAQGGDLEPEWQARFHRNIYEDSQKLADTTETLVRYLDDDVSLNDAATLPQDEVDTWLTKIGWRCQELEADADCDIGILIQREEALNSQAAKDMATRILHRYADDVRKLSESDLRASLSEGLTPTDIAQRYQVDLPCVFRRLASQPATAFADGQAVGLVACDGSGTLIFRKPSAGFALPRFSAACPLWPLFQALQRPMTPITQTITMSGRDELDFDTTAISNIAYPQGFGGPPVVDAWMLIQPRMLQTSGTRFVGTSCRVCSHMTCVARREPSVMDHGVARALTGFEP